MLSTCFKTKKIRNSSAFLSLFLEKTGVLLMCGTRVTVSTVFPTIFNMRPSCRWTFAASSSLRTSFLVRIEYSLDTHNRFRTFFRTLKTVDYS